MADLRCCGVRRALKWIEQAQRPRPTAPTDEAAKPTPSTDERLIAAPERLPFVNDSAIKESHA
jgi:hypothetical protein